eukprot:4351244-Ditylum_brightwellii.AAC.1
MGSVVTNKLQEKLKDCNVQLDLPAYKNSTQEALKKAQNEVKQIRKDTFEHRQSTMAKVAAVYALKGKKQKIKFFMTCNKLKRWQIYG